METHKKLHELRSLSKKNGSLFWYENVVPVLRTNQLDQGWFLVDSDKLI